MIYYYLKKWNLKIYFKIKDIYKSIFITWQKIRVRNRFFRNIWERFEDSFTEVEGDFVLFLRWTTTKFTVLGRLLDTGSSPSEVDDWYRFPTMCSCVNLSVPLCFEKSVPYPAINIFIYRVDFKNCSQVWNAIFSWTPHIIFTISFIKSL